MTNKNELKKIVLLLGLMVAAYLLPIGRERFDGALLDGFFLIKWYARQHLILCLLPAFFIAGFIAVFISQGAVVRYLGGEAKKIVAYGVSSVAGSVLAVCSCTILPLFASIYKRGAGLGPAVTFLYAGPAINVLSIILTIRILGLEIGLARILAAVLFSILIGLAMHFVFLKEERERERRSLSLPEEETEMSVLKGFLHFAILAAILVFTSWGKPTETDCTCYSVWVNKGAISSFFGILLIFSLLFVVRLKPLHLLLGSLFTAAVSLLFPGHIEYSVLAAILSLTVILALSDEPQKSWLESTWTFTKQILPLLAAGVLVAGFLLGAPNGGSGLIPESWIRALVGGNSVWANLFASVVGAFMYFATLTEIPILQGLMAGGMGKGPALALLLAGPALSLPNMLVIRSIIGTRKTIVFVLFVISIATLSGIIYGLLF